MISTSVLYHASENNELELIKPRRTLSKDAYIGDYVFATPDKRIAAMYLAPRAGGTILINTFNGEPYAVINNNAENFIKVDHGGAIYTVSSEAFTETPQAELVGTELIATKPVKPLSKEIFTTSIKAMQQMQVHIFFVEDPHHFAAIQNAKDHGWEILSGLTPYASGT
jgi:hypothetical protein